MKNKTFFYFINLILIVLIIFPSFAQKKAMTFIDCLDRPRASSPQLSPDNKWSVYTISKLDWDKRKRFTDKLLADMKDVNQDRFNTFIHFF